MNYYARAVEILDGITPEQAMRLLFKVAAKSPGDVVGAVDGPRGVLKGNRFDQVRRQCIALYLAGKRIDAIKEWRSATGIGLKEAKDAIESMVAGRE